MTCLSVHFVSRICIAALAYTMPLIAAVVILALAGILTFLFLKKKKSAAPQNGQEFSEQTVTEAIEQLNGSSQSILLAAARIDDLPVTIPINLAIDLSQKGTCLLIDFDFKRDAMAKAFSVNSSKVGPDLIVRPITTPIENLEIWAAGFFSCYKQMNLKMLIDTARKRYDFIILYAPYLPVLPDRKQIAYWSGQAIMFAHETDTDSPLLRLLQSQNCKIVSRLKSGAGL